MNIDRYNYEQFFLLYVDNELNIADRREVEDFIERNADLKKELLALQQSVLRPDVNVVFKNKEALLESVSGEGCINAVNYEQFFIDYLDDELTQKDKAAVEQFVYRHPEFQEEFELIQKLRLTPDSTIMMPDKNELYRFANRKKPVLLTWWRIAEAAMIVLIAGILWLNSHHVSRPKDSVSQINLTKPELNKLNAGIQNLPPQTSHQTVSKNKPAEAVKSQNQELYLSAKMKPETSAQRKHGMVKEYEGNLLNRQVAKNGETNVKPLTVWLEDITPQEAVNTKLASDKIDGGPTDMKFIIDEPVSTNEIKAPSEDAWHASAFSGDDENTFLTNISIDKKSSLRKVFRQASRLVEKTAAIGTGRKSGLSIGNIEIALQ